MISTTFPARSNMPRMVSTSSAECAALGGEKPKADLILVEIDVSRDRQRSAQTEIVLHCDDGASHRLTVAGEIGLHETHVTLDLANHRIAGAAALQFNDE